MNQASELDWTTRATSTDRSVSAFAAGEPLETGGDEIRLVNPADGSEGLCYRAANKEQVDQAVHTARSKKGGARWLNMPAVARRQCLLQLANLIDANANKLGMHDCLDVGKPISAACMEAHIAASLCRHFGEMADKLYTGQTVPTDPGSFEMHIRRPRGVVGAIIPWNYPVINSMLKLAPALAAGNAVILKPSELSPGSASILARLCIEAGIPAGTVNMLPGDGVTGSLLARHNGVDLLTFTGSTSTGKALMKAVGDTALKPLMLECGGKSPEIVFADAGDLGVDAIANAIVGGAMANQGQLCVARSRLYIEHSLYDDLVNALAIILENIAPGHPLDPGTSFGPLASPIQLQRVNDYVESGLDAGAIALVDGRGKDTPDSSGCYMAPTLFTHVSASTRIAREEIFGPVLSVFPFSSEAEAVELANDSEYGLAATVWTHDLARAYRLAQGIETGKLRISATTEQRHGAGWGHESEPCRQSGFGVEGGQMGIHSYTRLQSVQIDFPTV